MARLGHFSEEAVHTRQVQTLIDTVTLTSTMPPAMAQTLGVADHEPVEVWLHLGVERIADVDFCFTGNAVILSAVVLAQLDVIIDWPSSRLIPDLGTLEQPLPGL